MLHEIEAGLSVDLLIVDVEMPSLNGLDLLTALRRRGLSNKGIADVLDVSVSTVKFHVGMLFRLLNVRTRTECVHIARQRSLVDRMRRSTGPSITSVDQVARERPCGRPPPPSSEPDGRLGLGRRILLGSGSRSRHVRGIVRVGSVRPAMPRGRDR